MAFDDLNQNSREFLIAVLNELYQGDYEHDATLSTVCNTLRDEWYLSLAGTQVEVAASLNAAILVELEDTKYIRLVKGLHHIREYSFSKKAHDEYKLYIAPNVVSDVLADQPNLSSIGDPELRSIIDRDYQEIPRCLAAEAYKAATVMCGSVIEALLLDALLADDARAKQSKEAPHDSTGRVIKDLARWSLGSMINVAVDLRILSTTTSGLMSHAVREYRNLVHPAVQIRKQITPEKQEAKAAFAALDLIIKNLAGRCSAPV